MKVFVQNISYFLLSGQPWSMRSTACSVTKCSIMYFYCDWNSARLRFLNLGPFRCVGEYSSLSNSTQQAAFKGAYVVSRDWLISALGFLQNNLRVRWESPHAPHFFLTPFIFIPRNIVSLY